MFRGSAVAACLLLFFLTPPADAAARTGSKPRAPTPAKQGAGKNAPKPKAATPSAAPAAPINNAPVPEPSNVASLPPPPPPPVSSAFEPAPAPAPPPPPALPHGVASSPPPSSSPSAPSAPIAPLVRDRDHVEPIPAAPMRRLTVTLNPLPMIAGRYGANV